MEELKRGLHGPFSFLRTRDRLAKAGEATAAEEGLPALPGETENIMTHPAAKAGFGKNLLLYAIRLAAVVVPLAMVYYLIRRLFD